MNNKPGVFIETNSKEIREILFGSIWVMDTEYYQMADIDLDAWLETLEDTGSKNYWYTVTDFYSTNISHMLSIIINDIRKRIYERFNIDLNLSLLDKSVMVFFIVYNMFYDMITEKNDIRNILRDYNTRDIIDYILDAMETVNYVFILSDIIDLVTDGRISGKEPEIKHIVESTVNENIDLIKRSIEDFIINNYNIVNIMADAADKFEDLYILLTDLNYKFVEPLNKNRQQYLANMNVYDRVTEKDKIVVDVFNLRTIIVLSN